ncbi:MAG: aminopeptidase [Oscillospiraceae bacterium]|nr:aminopeptidase [Oscillospiraceae bacterium]
MIVIGITGGSGSGKTTLLKKIGELGGLCIDCDTLYHELLARDTTLQRAIFERFPEALVEGQLARKKLGEIVFSDPQALLDLNRITHGFVERKVQELLRQSSAPLAAIDAIGLFDSKLKDLCHITVAVCAPKEKRIERLMERDGVSKSYAESRIAAQKSDAEFSRLAQYTLKNDASTKAFEKTCDEFLKGVIPMEEKKYEALRKELLSSPKNGYDRISEADLAAMEPYCKEYMDFISLCKTEREAVDCTISEAEKKGFKPLVPGMALKPGDKVYGNGHGKCVIFAVIGTEPLNNGTHICAAHIDSPRLDLKPNPLYEDSEMAFFKTHYYGGIKKYQWTTTPLALHGVVVKKDRSVVKVTVGEDANDPIFCITDLLIHLSADQMKKPLAEGITGEGLRVLLGSRPLKDDEGGDRVKFAVMCLLHEKYGITEDDFLSAELTMVPAGPAREVGFDRSLIAAYGHDDRICAYAAFKPILELDTPAKTAVCVLADKEEVGSNGISGMQSAYFETFMHDLCKATGSCMRRCFENSFCLSADVSNAYDPLFPETCDKGNNTRINYGTGIFKYTGARGKSGSSDAAAEVMGYVRKLFAENDVIWQTGELGKVDQGGGGTVACFMANRNIETVDAGVPVLSMHAPMELVSKLDTYMTYKGMKVFYEDK